MLQQIFDRMNNSGKRLSRAEVFSAINAGTEHEAGDRLTIKRIAAQIDDRYGFGRVDDDTVLQCILARRGPDIQREIRWEFDPGRRRGVVDFPEEDRDDAYAHGEQALARTVEFLLETGVPHYAVLPYRYLLVVLTRFLALHPDLRPAEHRLLHRWFWRAAVVGPGIAKGSTTGVTRTLCTRISRASTRESLHGLLAVVGDSPPALPDPRRFRTNESAAKIVLCSWWHLGPRRPDTGEQYTRDDVTTALSESATAADMVRAVFPRRFVPDHQRLWAANRATHPVLDEPLASVSGLLQRPPLGVSEQSWSAVLRSHLIDAETEPLLLREDVSGFVVARQQEISRNLADFLTLKCE